MTCSPPASAGSKLSESLTRSRRWRDQSTLFVALIAIALLSIASKRAGGSTASLPSPAMSRMSSMDAAERPVATPAPVPVTIYTPTGEGPFPAVVVLHGGGFIGGKKEASVLQCMLLRDGGYVAIAVDYSLAPPGGNAHFPTPVEESMNVIAWARENADFYNIDADSVGVLGMSAGGTIADSAGIMGVAGSTRPDAVVTLSGPANLIAGYIRPKRFGRLTTAHILLSYIGCRPDECPAAWVRASPLMSAGRGDPPTLLVNGSNELVPLSDVREYSARLNSLKVAEETVIIPGVEHGSKLTDESWPKVMSFLDDHLK